MGTAASVEEPLPTYPLFEVVCGSLVRTLGESRTSIQAQVAAHPVWAKLDSLPARVSAVLTQSCTELHHELILPTLQVWFQDGVPSKVDSLLSTAEDMLSPSFIVGTGILSSEKLTLQVMQSGSQVATLVFNV